MVTKQAILVAPALQNSSCNHPRYHNLTFWTTTSPSDFMQSFILFLLTFGTLAANLLLICVINNRRFTKYLYSQPRFLLTSLACNNLAMGLCVTAFAIIPSLRNCWPYAEIVCQVQALLRGAISQQTAVILICIAMDRYYCMIHPAKYHKQSGKKAWLIITISITWVGSMTLYSMLVLKQAGFYFNATGMNACEPFYQKPSLRILAACGFYFPTTMILMYCYGSAFDVNKLRFRKSTKFSTISSSEKSNRSSSIEKLVNQERKQNTICSMTMAAMSLGFIVLVTPWTIQEVVAACTGTRAPPVLDFIATWLALSNSFWYPFIYWIMNNHFRRISKEMVSEIVCRKLKEKKQPPTEHYCNSSLSSNFLEHTPDCDFEGLSEKYWGEILERTLSSTSIHALHRSLSQQKLDKFDCSGTQLTSSIELSTYKAMVVDL